MTSIMSSQDLLNAMPRALIPVAMCVPLPAPDGRGIGVK